MTRPQNAVERAIQRRQFSGNAASRRRFVAVTEEVCDDLRKVYGVDRSSIDILPCPIDVEAIRAAPLADARPRFGIPDGTRLVLFVGNDFYRKGLDRAVRAVARLDPDVHLLVVGRGSPGRYRNLAVREGVSQRVHFVGHVARPEAYFREVDLLLLPTREDVWGTTLIEAMAAGVPIVTTAVAGASRIVARARAGVVVDEETRQRTLHDAAAAVLADSASRDAMAKRGQVAAARYDIAKLAPQLGNILRRARNGAC